MVTNRNRLPTARLLTALLLIFGLPLSASSQSVDFFESVLDGNWVGSVAIGNSVSVMQINLNVHGEGGIGFVVLQDNLGGVPTQVEVFPATLSKASDDGVTVTFEDDEALRRAKATTTLALAYDADSDTLTGSAKGGFKGDVELTRDDDGAPMTRLWEASGKLGGQNYYLLVQTQEGATSTGRFAATPIDGGGWFAGEFGTLTGEVNGKNVDFTLALDGGDVEISGKLKKKDNLLRGTISRDGNSSNLRATPAAGSGKAIKFQKVLRVAATELTVGEDNAVVIKGKNFNPGALVHVDDPDFEVTAVTFTSAKQLDVTIRPDAAVADGTVASLGVVNADGQSAEKSNAVTAAGGDDNGGNTVSFAADVQTIFNSSCALSGCHASGSAQGGLVLDSGSAFANLVGVPSSQQPGLNRVTPGNADMSYLVRKVDGVSPISGGRMPLNRTPLTQAEIDTIRTWINEGASNNRAPR